MVAAKTVRIRLQGEKDAVQLAKLSLPDGITWSKEYVDYAKAWSKAAREAPLHKSQIPSGRVRVYGSMKVYV